jgi:hypothetical protein
MSALTEETGRRIADALEQLVRILADQRDEREPLQAEPPAGAPATALTRSRAAASPASAARP